jgi:hypothetical protein
VTAGLPGTGIGGLFYLLCALLMPAREAYKYVISGGSYRPDPRALMQAAMALGIVVMIYVTGLLMLWLGNDVIDRDIPAGGLLRILLLYPAAVAFGTLFTVLALVEMLAAGFRLALSPRIAPSNDGGAGR